MSKEVDWMTGHYGWKEWLQPDEMINLKSNEAGSMADLNVEMEQTEGEGMQHHRFVQKKKMDFLG